MSFMIWYQVEFAEESGNGGLLAAAASLVGVGLPLRVSNDIFGGSFVLDADITVTMTDGAAADSFEIILVNLPAATISLLRERRAAGALQATVNLGYFDEPETRTGTRPVITGRVTSVGSTVAENGLSRTTIRGQESAGYTLLKRQVAQGRRASSPRIKLVRSLLDGTGVPLAPQSAVAGTVENYTVRARSVLGALHELAEQASIALVVRDGAVHLGPAVGSESAPVIFDPETNIVSRADGQAEDTALPPASSPGAEPASRPVRTSVELTVLGHPRLRVGQVATLTGLDDVPPGPLRCTRVVHRFGTATGYTCALRLVAVPAGQRAQTGGGVQGVVDRVQDVVSQQRADHPAVDVGEVTGYQSGADGKHLVSLHYAQSPAADVVAPSVASLVDTAVELHAKPLASPFAFHQCGLVLPVYPKMRALLAHNRGLVNDAVIAGWLWAEQPRHQPPPNQPGDYWLALPTGLDGEGLPTGKGVNDLTDATGRRVVQVRSLQVTVGQPALPDVGTRPEPPADDTISIEHHSGTKIAIDAQGALTITTSSKEITLSNGSVSVKLNGPTVEVS